MRLILVGSYSSSVALPTVIASDKFVGNVSPAFIKSERVDYQSLPCLSDRNNYN